MTDEELKVAELPIDELMAMARDARRYRWLRERSDGAPDDTPTVYSARRDGRILYGAGLDVSVDIAMRSDRMWKP